MNNYKKDKSYIKQRLEYVSPVDYISELEEQIEYLEYLKNENERLNNIIDELEKWLEEQHQFIIEIPAFTKEISQEHKTMELCYENTLDKLKELKGIDKDENN